MTAEAPHILVVDDDNRLRELLRKYLADKGFRVTAAADAKQARERLAGLSFDLIVCDIMMPGESGLELTQSLRRESNVPILLLTAMSEAQHRIAGLEQGADDYLAKPFEPRELVLRIQNVLRRSRDAQAAAAPRRLLRFGPHAFDLDRRELKRGQEEIRLTAAEAELLAALAQRAGEAVSREELSQQPSAEGSGRAVDVQITRLRRKIEPDPRFPRYLHTVRGRGYMLRLD
ncbi:response regulator [Hypericibacter sp.]|uniref:response regulator n=1 Tax=Hypericibacter sp. TaxID=2705401 RepID=UPI003D6D89B5